VAGEHANALRWNYHTSGEFGEFHPTAPDSREEISLRVVTTEPSEPADQPSADVQVSTDVENDIQLEMPMDHVITPFVEAQPEAWKQDILCVAMIGSTAMSWASQQRLGLPHPSPLMGPPSCKPPLSPRVLQCVIRLPPLHSPRIVCNLQPRG
jgi:hypothetical protein